MYIKKQISFILVVAILLSIFNVAVFAEQAANIWDGSVASGFESGNGTEADPYIVSTASQLAFFAQSVNSGNKYAGKYIKLKNDIALNAYDMFVYDENGLITGIADGKTPNEWTAIGISSPYYFCGVFDGENHTIQGLYINKPEEDFQGLFGMCLNATINNTGVTNAVINANNFVGSVVGFVGGTSVVSNCYNSGCINGSGSGVGGVLGYVNGNVKISECYNTGHVNGRGGIIGSCTNSGNAPVTVEDCYNIGMVSSTGSCGGIIGYNNAPGGSIKIKNCYNNGQIEGNSAGGIVGSNSAQESGGSIVSQCRNLGNINGQNSVGGVIGSNMASGGYIAVSNCDNLGNVSFKDFGGGVVGSNSANTNGKTIILNCNNKGTICSSNAIAGGVVGANRVGGENSISVIIKCYNSGSVNSANYDVGGITGLVSASEGATTFLTESYNTGDIQGDRMIGGITGAQYRYDDSKTVINNCYNIGSVSGRNFVGSIAGDIRGSGHTSIVTNCYYLSGSAKDGSITVQNGVGSETQGIVTQDEDGITIGLSNEQMKSQNSFVDFDFNSIWKIENDSTEYPYPQIIETATNPEDSNDILGLINSYDPNIVSEAEGFERGSGTEVDPYIISTAEQLAVLAQKVNNGDHYEGTYFKLTNDIILNDLSNFTKYSNGSTAGIIDGTILNEWSPIGCWSGSDYNYFGGIFDGNNHKVKGLYINKPNLDYQGLFGYCRNAIIKNIGIEDSYIIGKSYVGGIVGINYSDGTASIENCYNKGRINGDSRVGGIVGFATSGIINKCYNSGSISGKSYIGGVIGGNNKYGSDAIISCCYNTGYISGMNECIGGIVGFSDDRIQDCYNSGTIKGTGGAGGICGSSIHSDEIVKNCYNVGSVKGSGSVVAGSYNSENYMIESCYYLYRSAKSSSSSWRNSILTGTLTILNGIAGIADIPNRITALSEQQMKRQGSYVGFDFAGTWTMAGNPDYPYPELINLTHSDGYEGGARERICDFLAGGSCGENITWHLDYDGTLYINGTGDIQDFNQGEIAWIDYRECIKNVIISEGITKIGYGAFADCFSMKSISIPESVTSIEEYAFAECTNLSSISIPSGISVIKDHTFYRSGLQSIEIPYNITTIDGEAFYDCQFLESVIIGDGVESIDFYAFSDCTNLHTVSMGQNVKEIRGGAFTNCKSLVNIEIPDNVWRIERGTFYNCTGLTNVTIGEQVRNIDESSFEGCNNLSSIIMSPNIYILDDAFGGCNSLKDIYFKGNKDSWNWIVKRMTEGNECLTSARVHFNYGIETENSSGNSHHSGGYSGGYHVSSNIKYVSFNGGITKGSTKDGGNQIITLPIRWSFDLFSRSAKRTKYDYNTDLAVAGLVLSANSNSESISLLRSTLQKLEFKNISYGVYGDSGAWYELDSWLYNTNGYAIASNTVGSTNIIVIVNRGSTTNSDWISNLKSSGFRNAASFMKQQLDTYIDTWKIDTNKPTKIFITGHSRGGAVANILATMVTDITDADNVFVYTFAAPNTTDRGDTSKSNIFNFIHENDIVPYYPLGKNKYGHNITFNKSSSMKTPFYMLTDGLSMDNALNSSNKLISRENYGYGYEDKVGVNVFRNHAPVVYMSYLFSDMDEDKVYSIYKKMSVRCPVDVEVYDEYGTLVGKVVDNVVDETVGYGSLIFEIDGDEKYIYIPPACNYTVKLTGNDTGSMEYSVQDINTETGEIQEEKVFTDVALTAGKTMTSEVAEDIETSDIQLFVEQNEEITKEILTDGSEKDIKIVSFETNGGNEIRDISVEPGSTLPQIEAPKKEGYIFVGWYIDDELNTSFDFESVINENITLYAKYTPAYQVFAKIDDMTYDGEDLIVPVKFDYNHIDTAPWLAIYESGKLLKLQKCEIPAETSEMDIEVSIPGLNGLYDVKMLFFSDMDTLRPLSSCTYSTFFAY